MIFIKVLWIKFCISFVFKSEKNVWLCIWCYSKVSSTI